MSASTTYDVRLRYMLDNQAGNGLRGIEGGARAAAQSTGLLASNIARLGGAVAGAFGLNQARKALVDYNSSMEQAKITAAGLLQLNIGGSWTDNMSRATEVVSRLQQEAKTSVGTTADMVQMFSMLAQPLSAAGAGMDDFVNLTKASVVASRSMGIAAEVAALDVSQALRGQFNARDRFTGNILAPMGYAGESGRSKFNALPDARRLAELRKAMSAPAISEMAKAQGDSFAGVLSTFEDNLQIAFGKVGLPLFKQITAEVQRWNQWLDKNDARLQQIGSSLGKGLVEAFDVLKETAAFFVRHKDTIESIAKLWLQLKIVGIGASGLGGIVSQTTALGGAMDALRGGKSDGIGGLVSGFGGLADKITGTAGALVALTAAAMALGNWLGERNTEKLQAEQKTMFTGPQALKDLRSITSSRYGGYDLERFAPALAAERHDTQTRLFKHLKSAGLAGSNGVDQGAFSLMLKQDRGLAKDYAEALGLRRFSGKSAKYIPEANTDVIAAGFARAMDSILKNIANEANKPVPPIDTKKQDTKPPKVQVTIQRIEVASDDPDRFIFNLEQAVSKVARNPGQARRLLR